MPIAITINGEEILADKIEISEFQIKITPFKGISGKLELDYEQFKEFQDKMVKWVESAASSSQ